MKITMTEIESNARDAIQKRTDKELMNLAELLPIAKEVRWALWETNIFDEEYGDSFAIEAASWSDYIEVEIKDIFNFCEVEPLFQLLEDLQFKRGTHTDSTYSGMRTWPFHKGKNFSRLIIHGRLMDSEAPNCKAVEFTEIKYSTKYVCE